MAKFLQDTIEDTALRKKKAAKVDEGSKLEEFSKFIESVRFVVFKKEIYKKLAYNSFIITYNVVYAH